MYDTHAWVLHDCVALGAAPEQFACPTHSPSERTHTTSRDCVPPPHDAEHEPYAPVAQLYVYVGAQAWVLQDWEVTGVPQLAFPTVAPSERTQVAERVWVPPPHDAEHVP